MFGSVADASELAGSVLAVRFCSIFWCPAGPPFRKRSSLVQDQPISDTVRGHSPEGLIMSHAWTERRYTISKMLPLSWLRRWPPG